MRDRHDADLHVLVTERETGSGGTEGVSYVTRPPKPPPPLDHWNNFA